MAFDRVTRAALPQDAVTNLHLLRHGQVDTGGRRRAYGFTDAPLSTAGIQQARDLAAFVSRNLTAVDGVLSSDLQRCLKTAAPIADALGVALEVLPALREQNMGDWEWQTWETLTLNHEQTVRRYWSDYLNTCPPGGESFLDVTRRVTSWWAESLPRLWGRRWIVVGHIGVIRALLCELFDHPTDQALRFAPKPGTHTHVLVASSGAVLQVLGERTAGGSASQPVVNAARAVDADRPLRLAMSGSAGVGKTSLGQRLASSLGVPYVPEGMRSRLEAGLSLHDLDHGALCDLVEELWVEQQAAEDAAIRSVGGFVSDRSALDYAAFWLYYRFTGDMARTERFFASVMQRAALVDRIVLLPWGVVPLVADGVRAPNPWLQRHYQSILEGLLFREVAADRLLVLPALDGLEKRARWVLRSVGAR